MKTKKLQLFRIGLLGFATGAILIANGGFSIQLNKTAFAVGDLSVDWGVPEGNPIFTIFNMAPGQVEEHSVSVTNNAPVLRPIGVRGIKTSETGGFANALSIVIQKNLVDVYGGSSPTGVKSLGQFFTESGAIDGVFLANQNSAEVASYKFTVIFESGSGNEFQNKNVVFDLQIGISVEVPADCLSISFTGSPIMGTAGNNNINGTLGNDLIYGLEGNDKINGKGGNDCIVGGEGNDQLKGGTGKDVLFGDAGNDQLEGGSDDDILNDSSGSNNLKGGSGDDLIRGGSDNDIIDGGSGNDNITGGTGVDTIDGGSDRDEIFGGDQNDVLTGGSGNDSVFGENGNDNLKGGSGNDLLDGGAGTNTLNGESGTDTCLNATTKTKCELP